MPVCQVVAESVAQKSAFEVSIEERASVRSFDQRFQLLPQHFEHGLAFVAGGGEAFGVPQGPQGLPHVSTHLSLLLPVELAGVSRLYYN